MVYESDFYTRRPYTRPTITSYSVTALRPCMSIRGVIAPPGTHSKVRMSVLLGELNRIQHRHRPHLAIVPTEDFLCSRPLVDFDDEAKHIRAAADKLIRYVHTSVPHESRLPARIITAYDRYAPEGRYVSKYSPDIPTNIQCMSYYTEPSRATIGRGHLACVSYAGGRGYPRRKHLYSDEIRDIGDEIKFRSYYARNFHPSRNDDALLLPTGFASRILLPDRRLVGTDEGRALVFQSKLIKPVSSGLSIKREKPEKKAEKSSKQKSRSQAIEEQILAEEAKAAASKPIVKVVEVVEIEEPTKEAIKDEESPQQITRQLSTPAVPDPEPEPPKETTPPPVEAKPKPKKDIKKKSAIKTPPAEVEPLVEAAPAVEPVSVEEPDAVEEPETVEEPKIIEEPTPADTPLEPEPEVLPKPVSEEELSFVPAAEEPDKELKEEPVAHSVEEPVVQAETIPEPEATPVEPEQSQPEDVSALAESQVPAEDPIQELPTIEPEVVAEPAAPEAEEQKEEAPAVEAAPIPESSSEQAVPEDDTKVEEVQNPTESECAQVEEHVEAIADDKTQAEAPTPPLVEEATEEQMPAEDPQSRLEAAPEAEPENATTSVPETSVEAGAEPTDPTEPQTPSDEPVISELEGVPPTEIPPETTEPIVEEPPSPITEQ